MLTFNRSSCHKNTPLFVTKQGGFLGFGLTGYIVLGMSMIVLGLGIALKVQSSRLDSVKQEYAHFVADVKAKGEAAKVKAEAENKLNKERKEKADVELKKLRLANADLNKRLRDNASRSFVPRTEADPTKFERACFDQSAIDAAIKRFAERVTGIVEQGQDALDSLNNAKEWAQER